MATYYNRKIAGLFVNSTRTNMYVHISGIGWRVLRGESHTEMAAAAIHAKAQDRYVTIYTEDANPIMINAMYVW